jgi:predicted RNase H-like HicB family nuclease
MWGTSPDGRGAHTQAETVDELHTNLVEVIELLLKDGEPRLNGEFIGIHTVLVS